MAAIARISVPSSGTLVLGGSPSSIIYLGAANTTVNFNSSNITGLGATTVDSLTTTSGATVGNGLIVSAGGANITGNSTNTGTFTVSGSNATVLDGSLDVAGATTLTGSLSAAAITGTGAVSIANTLAVTGSNATTLGGTLAVAGNTALAGTLGAGNTTITGTATVSSTLGVTGNTTLSGTLAAGATTITGTATVSSTLGVTGATSLAAVTATTVAATGAISTSSAGSVTAPAIQVDSAGVGLYTKGDDLLAVAIGSKDRLLLHGARSGLADATATTIFQTDATCTNNSRFSFIVHYEALVVDSVIAAYTQVQTGTVKVAGKVIGATSTAESIVDDSVQYVTADALAVTFSVAVASDILSFRVAMDTTGTPTNLTRSIKYSVWLFDQYILTVVSS